MKAHVNAAVKGKDTHNNTNILINVFISVVILTHNVMGNTTIDSENKPMYITNSKFKIRLIIFY